MAAEIRLMVSVEMTLIRLWDFAIFLSAFLCFWLLFIALLLGVLSPGVSSAAGVLGLVLSRGSLSNTKAPSWSSSSSSRPNSGTQSLFLAFLFVPDTGVARPFVSSNCRTASSRTAMSRWRLSCVSLLRRHLRLVQHQVSKKGEGGRDGPSSSGVG